MKEALRALWLPEFLIPGLLIPVLWVIGAAMLWLAEYIGVTAVLVFTAAYGLALAGVAHWKRTVGRKGGQP